MRSFAITTACEEDLHYMVDIEEFPDNFIRPRRYFDNECYQQALKILLKIS